VSNKKIVVLKTELNSFYHEIEKMTVKNYVKEFGRMDPQTSYNILTEKKDIDSLEDNESMRMQYLPIIIVKEMLDDFTNPTEARQNPDESKQSIKYIISRLYETFKDRKEYGYLLPLGVGIFHLYEKVKTVKDF
jgi:hypothetical protein